MCLLGGCRSPPADRPGSGIAAPLAAGSLLAAGLLSGDDTRGFARAVTPPSLSFPGDHGPHPSFRTEWWYFTGLLQAKDQEGRPRRFGYQLTIFRQALSPEIAARASSWATRDVYLGHLAVSDLDGDARGQRFRAGERFARDGLGLAGSRGQPFEVWVESWRMSGPGSGSGPGGADDIFPVTLRAGREADGAEGGGGSPALEQPLEIDLSVSAGRGPILQGDRGLSEKGAGAGLGNASIYYSCTRLPTRGRITIDGRSFEVVSGLSWLDREWSTSALDAEVVGWDWLGASLDDGRDLMLCRLRTRDGRAAIASRATLIAPDGSTRVFQRDAFTLLPRGQWESPDRRARYPAGFHLSIPIANLEVTIRPLLADQELLLGVRYWEGAVALEGSAAGQPLGGRGYLELTGYAGGDFPAAPTNTR